MPQTLLVIDDEPQIRRVVRNAFKDTGARVLEAVTGAEGIDLAAAEHPDLIVLDLGLPDIVAGGGVPRDPEVVVGADPGPLRAPLRRGKGRAARCRR